jgi:hypothetical protein
MTSENILDSTISFLVPCAIIAVASIPLMLNVVPPNRVYGLRTRQTFAYVRRAGRGTRD